MRIAVASDGLNIADNFMQSKNFNYYTTEGFEVIDSMNIPAEGITCEEYAHLMELVGIDALICNSITPECHDAFEAVGIRVQEGVRGNALKAAQDFAAAQLGALDRELQDDCI